MLQYYPTLKKLKEDLKKCPAKKYIETIWYNFSIIKNSKGVIFEAFIKVQTRQE
jgi:hypothetical protein